MIAAAATWSWLRGAAGAGREQHGQRPQPFAAVVNDVVRDLIDERDVAAEPANDRAVDVAPVLGDVARMASSEGAGGRVSARDITTNDTPVQPPGLGQHGRPRGSLRPTRVPSVSNESRGGGGRARGNAEKLDAAQCGFRAYRNAADTAGSLERGSAGSARYPRVAAEAAVAGARAGASRDRRRTRTCADEPQGWCSGVSREAPARAPATAASVAVQEAAGPALRRTRFGTTSVDRTRRYL